MTVDAQESRARERIGRVLEGKWKLERLLGMGGMAAVYAARHRNGARAAVKMLHPELAKHAQLRDRFLREGYAANRVEHPGAVAVLDDDVVEGGPDDGAAYIVMELLEGEVLEERAARARLSEAELLQVADSVLDVLAAAHAHGVIHRDLKPDNLFIPRSTDGSLRVKVLDFGLARVAEGSRLQTRAGITLGTPAYMSPEQAAGRADEIDGRSDLFSLGAVLFRLRTGKRVHEADSPLELVTKMAKVPALPIREVDPSVSEAFAAIVDRAVAFRREDRYPDAAAMRADVRAALDALAPAPVAAPPVAAPRRSSGRWLPLLSASVLVGVAAAWLASARFSPAPPRATAEAPSAQAVGDASVEEAATPADAADETPEAAALLVVDADLDAVVDAGGDASADALGDAEDEEEEEEDDEEEDAAVSTDADTVAALEDAAPAPEDAPHDVAVAAAKPKVAAPPPPTAHPTTKKPAVKAQPPPKKKAPTTTKKVTKKKRKKKRW